MFLVYRSYALHIVGNVIILQLVARDTARPTLSRWRAPINITDLKQSVIRAAIPIQPPHRRCVEPRLMVCNAHPRRHLLQSNAVPLVEFTRQFAALKHLAPFHGYFCFRHLRQFLSITTTLIDGDAIPISCRRRRRCRRASVQIPIGTNATMRLIHGPRIETIAAQPFMLLVDLPDAAHIVRDIAIHQTLARQLACADRSPPRTRSSRRRAPVQIADLEEPIIGAAVPVQATNGGRVQARFVLGNAHPRGNLCGGNVMALAQFGGQLAASVHLPRRHHRGDCRFVAAAAYRRIMRHHQQIIVVPEAIIHIVLRRKSTAMRPIHRPRREPITGQPLMLRMNRTNAAHIVRYIGVG